MADPQHSAAQAKKRISKRITYGAVAINAIKASAHGRCTIKGICDYAARTSEISGHPSSTWQSSMRQTLSRDKRFIKLKRQPGSRVSEWMHCPLGINHKKEKNNINLLSKLKSALKAQGTYKEFKVRKEEKD